MYKIPKYLYIFVPMKRRVVYFLLAGLLTLPFATAYGQGSGGDVLPLLYRGKIAQQMAFRYNGTFFADPFGFQEGAVMYNGKLYSGVEVQLDAYRQQLCVRMSPAYSPVIPDRDQVAWFRRGGSLFANLRYFGFEKATEGFFEVLYDGKSSVVVRQIRKILDSTPGDKNGEVIGYDDPDYDASVITYFRHEEHIYHISSDGTVTQLRKSRDLNRIYPERKTDIRRFVSKNGLQRSNPVVYYPFVMEYLEGSASGEESIIGKNLDKWHPGGGVETLPSFGIEPHRASLSRDLPEDFFSEKVEEPVEYEEEAQSVTYQNKLYVIGREESRQRRAVISGTVTDSQDGAPLPGVVIFDDNTNTYVRTDAAGRYRIDLPTGENYLNFNDYSKESLHINIALYSNGTLDVAMHERITALKAAVVSAESMANHRTASMGVEKISMKTIGKIPSAFGEGDVIKAVMTLPGVKSVGEAAGGFNVRGGASDQNLILFNGSTIYNPNHMFGMFSSFNPDIVENVELYKSSIPAEYGGRISSVLSVKSKEGSREKVTGTLGVGVLTSRFHIEGPFRDGKTTFIAGGRTTYSDWILKRLPSSSGYSGGSAGFSDANLGVTHRPDGDNTLQFNAYWARDRFSFNGDTSFYYQNINASLMWKHEFDEEGRSLEVSAGYDHFNNTLEDMHRFGEYTLDTYIRQGWVRSAFRRKAGDHALSYGADLTAYGLDPGIMRAASDSSLVASRTLDREYAVELAAFVGDTWRLTDEVSLDGGLRFSGFLSANDVRFYGIPEVRLSAKYSPMPSLSFKAGFNTLRQYIHLISNTSSLSPMDTWKLSDGKIRPTDGWQLASGGYWTNLDTGIDFSLEAYWKRMYNYLDYKSGATLTMNPDLADDLVRTRGKAYGIEFQVKKTTGRLNGWASYTWSRTLLQEMEDRGPATINGGSWYNAPHDKPHDFKAAVNYAFTHRYSVSVNVDYSTGRPVTIPVGMYYYDGGYRLAYSARNSYRIPDYFRVDAALNIDPGHYLKAVAHSSITIGVYNVLGRKNPYSVYFTSQGGYNVRGYMVSVFATQVPYINLNIIF